MRSTTIQFLFFVALFGMGLILGFVLNGLAHAATPGVSAGVGACHKSDNERFRWEYRVKGGGLAVEKVACPEPPPPEPVVPVVEEVTPEVSPGVSSGYSIPEYIVECESGGSYTAENPSSGAYGAYQIMPEHWDGGVCSDLGHDPTGQDECAARLWDGGAGASNWVCAG